MHPRDASDAIRYPGGVQRRNRQRLGERFLVVGPHEHMEIHFAGHVTQQLRDVDTDAEALSGDRRGVDRDPHTGAAASTSR